MLKKEGHKVELIDTTFGITRNEIINKTRRFSPDLVAVTAATNDFYNAIKICKLIKQIEDILVVCGGYHPTIAPEEVIKQKCFDVVAMGEAEYSFLKLIKSEK